MEKLQEQSANLQVQQQEPKNSFIKYVYNQEELTLVQVSLRPSFRVGSGKKEVFDNLIDLVAKWRWMAGISSNGQDENELAKEFILISKFISDNYPNLSIDEINLAISLSLTDKLNIDVRAFNVFSPMYVSRILNAFLEYKKRLLNDILQRKLSYHNKKENEKQPTPKEKMDSMIDLIRYFLEQFNTKGEINDYFSTLYNFFRKIGILNPSKEVVNKALEYGKTKASEELIESAPFGKFKSNNAFRGNVEKRYARNYCVQNLFETENVESIISKINLKHFE